MKRLATISAALFLVVLFVPFLVSSSAVNLFQNGGFETGSTSGFSDSLKSKAVTGDQKFSGSYSLQIPLNTTNDWKVLHQKVNNIQAGDSYVFTAQVKTDAASNGNAIRLKVVTVGAGDTFGAMVPNAYMFYKPANTGWNQVCYTFSSASVYDSLFFVIEILNTYAPATVMYLDDIGVYKKQPAESPDPANLLQNGGFESGDLTSYYKQNGIGPKVVYGTESVPAHSGQYMGLCEPTAAWTNLWQMAALEPNTAYVVSGYFSGRGITQSTSLLTFGMRLTGTAVPADLGAKKYTKTLSVSDDNWHECSVTFNSGEYTAMHVYVECISTLPFYLDSLTLKKIASVTDDSGANGALTFDKTTANPGETVTVTVAPSEGYQLKAGSLRVNGTPLTARVGSTGTRDESISNRFTFAMPSGSASITAEFIPDTEQNLAVLGASFKEDDMRFVSRAYRSMNGKSLTECGTILMKQGGRPSDITAALRDGTALTPEQAAAIEAALTSGNFDGGKVKVTKLRDRCSDYVDYTVQITGAGETGYSSTNYIAIAYSVYSGSDGSKTTVYSAPCIRSYDGLTAA